MHIWRPTEINTGAAVDNRQCPGPAGHELWLGVRYLPAKVPLLLPFYSPDLRASGTIQVISQCVFTPSSPTHTHTVLHTPHTPHMYIARDGPMFDGEVIWAASRWTQCPLSPDLGRLWADSVGAHHHQASCNYRHLLPCLNSLNYLNEEYSYGITWGITGL